MDKQTVKKMKADAIQYAANIQAAANISPLNADVAESGEIRSKYEDFTDRAYFDSYSKLLIHEQMLRDYVRTKTYMNAICSDENKALFKGKTVLDVGCGTGILCLFAAKAGALRVIGVDASGIVDHAQKIVQDNGYADIITIVRGRIEDVALPVESVDIIVSEWMVIEWVCFFA